MADRRRSGNRRGDDRRQNHDRRDIPRYPAQSQLRIMPASNTKTIVPGQLLDASPTGARLVLQWDPELDVRLLIEVQSPGHACMNLLARVIWTEPTADEGWFRVGCTFLQELTNTQSERLHTLAACYQG